MTDNNHDVMLATLTTDRHIAFWSDPQNIVRFLLIQSHLYHAASPKGVDPVGIALEEAAEKIQKIIDDPTRV